MMYENDYPRPGEEDSANAIIVCLLLVLLPILVGTYLLGWFW